MSKNTFQLGETVVPKSYKASGYVLIMTIHQYTDIKGQAFFDSPSDHVYCKYYFEKDGTFKKELFHFNELEKA